MGSLDAYLPNQRLDNAFTYRGTFGAWTLGAAYSNARDGSAPSNCGPQHGSACAAYSALVKYDNRRWGVALAHDRLKGVKGSGFFGQPAGLTFGASAAAVLERADALLIATEWKEFRSPDFDDIHAQLRQPVIFDGRNLYDPARMAERGFEYYGIGRGRSAAPASAR